MADDTITKRYIDDSSELASRNFQQLIYPEDLSSEQYSSYMTFTIYDYVTEGIKKAEEQGSGQSTKLATTIVLYVPSNLATRYATEVVGTDISRGGIDALGGWDAAQSMLMSKGQELYQSLMYKNADMASARSKTAKNNRRMVAFKGVENRTFSFDFHFTPKSATESANVKRILDTFRYYMHPSVDGSGSGSYTGAAWIKYPSEFQIDFFFKDTVNGWLFNTGRCFLNGMDVNYGPSEFSTFANGAPTEINLNLAFTEIEVLTRERIKNFEDGLTEVGEARF